VPTAFYDTVVAAAKYLVENSADRHRRVIVVISDGDDNFSTIVRDVAKSQAHASQTKEATRAKQEPTPPKKELTPAENYQNLLASRRSAVVEVQRLVQQADAAFYSVNPGGPSIHLNDISMRAQNAMNSIAQSTGGTAYVPDGEKDLERVFNEVAAELRGQYLLQYYSNSQAAGTQFRRIAVGVAHPELRVRARQGYYPKQGTK
jgi:Ca-activated chloride channel family protein